MDSERATRTSSAMTLLLYSPRPGFFNSDQPSLPSWAVHILGSLSELPHHLPSLFYGCRAVGPGAEWMQEGWAPTGLLEPWFSVLLRGGSCTGSSGCPVQQVSRSTAADITQLKSGVCVCAQTSVTCMAHARTQDIVFFLRADYIYIYMRCINSVVTICLQEKKLYE